MNFLGPPTRIDRSALPLWQAYPLAVVGFFVAMAFLAFPMPLDEKAHIAMHGLCAQRPSHSFVLDGKYLPFDARMTGIYGGFLVAFVLLMLSGRRQNAGLPSLGSGAVLLLFLGSMAFDGFNSLFVDLGLAHTHSPDNRIRFLTGAGVGVGLAVIMAMLIAMTVWADSSTSIRITSRWWQPVTLWMATLPLGAIIVYGPPHLYAMHTILLITSALVAFSGLALVCYVMITRREQSFTSLSDLQQVVIRGVAGGLVVIGMLSAARFLVEAIFGAPPLT